MSRRTPGPARTGRRRSSLVAVVLAAALLAAGLGSAAPALAAPARCAAPPVTVLAPASGATLAAGSTRVTGTSSTPGARLAWRVTGDGGARVAAGSTSAAGAAFAFAVELAPGAYTLSIRSSSRSVLCAAVTQALQVTGGSWASGASGAGVAGGAFAAWRGSAVPIAGTWSDSDAGQTGLWPLRGEYAGWTGDLDLAIGAIDDGETWAAAATGAYDARWTRSLQEAAGLWRGHTGTLYLRFAHEFNGDWYPWAVTAATAPDFVAAWHRFRALQQRWFPASRLVFSPTGDTAGSSGLDWRRAFPGAGDVDVLSVDYFNQWPWVNSAADFERTSLAYDRFGAPRGIERYRQFAAGAGLPFAVSEWGNNATFGDAPEFVAGMRAFFSAHAGTGAGQLRYEILFDVYGADDGNPFSLSTATRSPASAESYRRLW